MYAYIHIHLYILVYWFFVLWNKIPQKQEFLLLKMRRTQKKLVNFWQNARKAEIIIKHDAPRARFLTKPW